MVMQVMRLVREAMRFAMLVNSCKVTLLSGAKGIAPEVLRRYGQANVGSVSAGCLHGVPEAGHAEVMSARCATKTERTARAAWPL